MSNFIPRFERMEEEAKLKGLFKFDLLRIEKFSAFNQPREIEISFQMNHFPSSLFFPRSYSPEFNLNPVEKDTQAVFEELNLAKQQLKDTETEYHQLYQTVHSDSNYWINYTKDLFETFSLQSNEQEKLKERVATLITELADIDYRLTDVKKYLEPSTIQQLNEDCSTYQSIINLERSQIKSIRKKTEDKQKQLFHLLTTPSWKDTTTTLSEHQVLTRVKSHLETLISNLTIDPSDMSETVSIETVRPDLLSLIQHRNQLEGKCTAAQIERTQTQIRKRVGFSSLLEELQRLDIALLTLGKDGINISDYRKKYLPEGPYSPMKRPKSSAEAQRKAPITTDLSSRQQQPIRSRSDIKRPIVKSAQAYGHISKIKRI